MTERFRPAERQIKATMGVVDQARKVVQDLLTDQIKSDLKCGCNTHKNMATETVIWAVAPDHIEKSTALELGTIIAHEKDPTVIFNRLAPQGANVVEEPHLYE